MTLRLAVVLLALAADAARARAALRRQLERALASSLRLVDALIHANKVTF